MFIAQHVTKFCYVQNDTNPNQRREREGGGKRGKDERWFDAKEDE